MKVRSYIRGSTPSKLASILVFLVLTATFSLVIPVQVGAAEGDGWTVESKSPYIGGYAVGVTGAGDSVYIASSTGYPEYDDYFMRYNVLTKRWESLETPGGSSWSYFQNSVALTWDNGDSIYALTGSRYGDSRYYFYRYTISSGKWQRMADTPFPQGAGDAITWVPGSVLGSVDDNFLYAFVGSNEHGTRFIRYSIQNNRWEEKRSPLGDTDDGASLVWTGSTYLYALRGEYDERDPSYDFWRYDITNDRWESKADIPAWPHDGGSGGVGDGGSLLWVGGAYSDKIFALSGNQAHPETPDPIWDKRFYRYTISTDSWENLEDLPKGVGDQNGPRLAYAGGNIYAWRGCNGDRTLWKYELNLDTTPPEAFDLLSPADGSSTTDTTPTFSWEASNDPESGLAGYDLYIDDELDKSVGPDTTSTTPSSPLPSGTHEWYVVARNNAELSTQSTSTFTLEILGSGPGIDIEVTPSTHDFGELNAGEEDETSDGHFTVKNVGELNASISIRGNDAVNATTGEPTWTLSGDGSIDDDIFAMWFRLLGMDWEDLKKEGSPFGALGVGEDQQFDLKLKAPDPMSTPGRMKTVVTLIAVVGARVTIDIAPDEQEGYPGQTLEFTVTVTNLDSKAHTFDLTWEDTLDWPDIDIDPTELPLQASESGEAILRVTIPEGASLGDVNEITITATAQDDPNMTASATCKVTVIPGEYDEESIEIYVRGVSKLLNIEVTPSTYDFGELRPAEIKETSDGYFTVKNVGELNVSISIRGNDAVDATTGEPTWTLSGDGSIDDDIFAMWFRLLGMDWEDLKKEGSSFGALAVGEDQQFDLKLKAPDPMSTPGRMKTVVTLIAVVG